MRLSVVGLSVLLLGVAAFVVADEALDLSLVEAGAQLPNEEFTICLRDRPMMCLAAGADLKVDGSPLVLGDRLRTAGQTFRLENGVLKFSGSGDRVVAAEHGAQNKLDTQEGGRVWIWKQQELAFEQQWLANEELSTGSAQLCMRAFPKACLYTSFPSENKVIIANADHARTQWVLRPVKPCAGNPCDANAQCAEQPDGQAKCTCNAGYKLGPDNKCFEVDLCANPSTNPCDEHASCAKTGPAKTACTCHNGFTGKGEKGQCAPINACTADPKHPPCDANAACLSTGPNLFKCQCKPGFVPTGPTSCAELDLCATANPCAATATCTKTGPGKVSCQCNPGFAGNGQSCVAVDGCEGTPCGEHATCVRQPLGGRQCNCDVGYAVDKKSKAFRCAEADQCALTGAAAVCKGRNTYCKKTGPGTHKCLCKPGFLAFYNGNCEKPGSKEALEAAAQEGSESARQEMIIQQRKAKEAEMQRKEMEREFRRKQKEREENIRALERRIRDLIREKTNARITKRDTHISQLSERVSQIMQQQAEASKTAAIQLQLIKAMEQNEAGKAKRLEAVVAQVTKNVQDQAVAYATKLREATRDRMNARLNAFDVEQKLKDIAATKAARGPPMDVEAKTGKAPAAPPQYGNNYSTPPLKLPIGKPTLQQKHAQEKAANAYASSTAAPKPAPAPATGPSVAATTAAAAPNPKPEQPVRNPAEVASRFQQVDMEVDAEADAEAEAESEADAAVAHRVEAETSADAQHHVTAEVEVDQSAELLAAAEDAAAHTPAGEMEHDIAAEMANLSSQDVEQSDEDLAEQLMALHADVDAHLSQVMIEDDAHADSVSFFEADADVEEDEAEAGDAEDAEEETDA